MDSPVTLACWNVHLWARGVGSICIQTINLAWIKAPSLATPLRTAGNAQQVPAGLPFGFGLDGRCRRIIHSLEAASGTL